MKYADIFWPVQAFKTYVAAYVAAYVGAYVAAYVGAYVTVM